MKSEKGQSLIMVGVALFLLAGLCLYIGLSQPKISSGVLVETPATAVQSGISAQATSAAGADSVASSKSSTAATAGKTAAAADRESTVSYPVNLNTATAEQLTSISGIGDQRAAAILAYREQLGQYTSVEQIKEIRGIGDGLYAKIAPYLTV